MDLERLLCPEEWVAFVVEAEDAGRRLDLLLHGRVARWASRTAVSGWIREGRATVNGVVVRRPARAAGPGDRVELRAPKNAQDLDASIDDLLPLVVLHRGADWVVVDKPGGLSAHPARGTVRRTLVVVAAVALRGEYAPGGPWLGHRLDRETSGLNVVALTRDARRRFHEAFEARAIRRRYRAVVRGRYDPPAVLDAPLRLETRPPYRVRVVGPKGGGQDAETRVHVLAHEASTSELLIEPITGRQHQIRVHLADQGHAIVGDPFYDPGAAPGEPMRLHACELTVPADVAGASAPVVVRSAPVWPGAGPAADPGGG